MIESGTLATPVGATTSGDHQRAPAGGARPEPPSLWKRLGSESWLSKSAGRRREPAGKLSPRDKAQLLYDYCLASDRRVSETYHNLFIIAEHYWDEKPKEIQSPEGIHGIPSFFAALTAKEKAVYCYAQVTEGLSLEALPVTVESLRATKRTDPNDPWSSYAGRFVRRVAMYVTLSLLLMFGLWKYNGLAMEEARWVAFGCLGALVHLLNSALTTTRLQTFELSEARKIWPRLLLGGMFGFVLPWLLMQAGVMAPETAVATSSMANSASAIAAFFGGYSVRFATGLLERLLSAVFPETTARP
jgi:hypothetical protein